MNIKRPLMPGFLKRAEQKLLLNKPLIWSTRVHLVLYYGILFILFLTVLSFLDPADVRDSSHAGEWIGFVSIICIIGFTVWLIYLLRFNVFKKYGNIHPLHSLTTFLLYFICTGIIILFGFVYPVVECVRANMAYSEEEIVRDINNINIRLCQAEHNLLNRAWNYDTVILSKNAGPESPAYEEEVVDGVATPTTGKYYFKLDSTGFAARLAKSDSVVKVNDSVYLMYKTPDLEFVTTWWAYDATKEKLLSSFQLYNKALGQALPKGEAENVVKELRRLLNKYTSDETRKKYEGLTCEIILPGDPIHETIIKKYRLRSISDNIWNIERKMESFSGRNLSEAIRLFYYLTLGITLLVFIFRHTTARTFFLSLLTGVLLTIFTALILSFSHGSNEAFLGWMVGYMLVFFVGSLFILSAAKRKVITGILVNLFVFIVPIFPLLIVAWYREWKERQYYAQYSSYEGFHYMDQYIIYAEIGGAILLLILLATYIHKIYRRWYSLPEH